MKKIVTLILPVLAFLAFSSCDKDTAGEPVIVFEGENNGISEIFPGDPFTVQGVIHTDVPISKVFYFVQNAEETTGKIEETGDRMAVGPSGLSTPFSLDFTMDQKIVGIKIIAEDKQGNRSVKIFKVNKGVDGLEITFDAPGYLESITSGETFRLKGNVSSKTKLTGFSYQTVRGNIKDQPVNIDITNDKDMDFDLPIEAQNGMTGVVVTAQNQGELILEKSFEINHVVFVGPVVLFERELVEVKPDSLFTVKGSISSNLPIVETTYSAVRNTIMDSPMPLAVNNGEFELELNAGEDVTAVAVTAVDTNGNKTVEQVPVSILFPSVTEGDVMLHYKNIILTDDKFSKTYFSFDTAPYVLDKDEAFANQSTVNLIYSNVFVSDGHAVNGPAIFGPSVSGASTINSSDLIEGWTTPINLSRTPAASDFYNSGMTFEDIGDTSEVWNSIDDYIKGKIGGSSVVRQYNMSVGYMFAIGFGGTSASDINKYAIVIVRGIGGDKATSAGESTGAWVELEIKIRKQP